MKDLFSAFFGGSRSGEDVVQEEQRTSPVYSSPVIQYAADGEYTAPPRRSSVSSSVLKPPPPPPPKRKPVPHTLKPEYKGKIKRRRGILGRELRRLIAVQELSAKARTLDYSVEDALDAKAFESQNVLSSDSSSEDDSMFNPSADALETSEAAPPTGGDSGLLREPTPPLPPPPPMILTREPSPPPPPPPQPPVPQPATQPQPREPTPPQSPPREPSPPPPPPREPSPLPPAAAVPPREPSPPQQPAAPNQEPASVQPPSLFSGESLFSSALKRDPVSEAPAFSLFSNITETGLSSEKKDPSISITSAVGETSQQQDSVTQSSMSGLPSQGGLFGNLPPATQLTAPTTESTSLFGNNLFGSGNSQSSAPSLFGPPANNQTNESASLFGNSLFGSTNTQSPAPSLFGASGGGQTSLFGSSVPTQVAPVTESTPSIFGNSAGALGTTTSAAPSLFGQPANQPSLFDNSASAKPTSLFDTSSTTATQSLFGNSGISNSGSTSLFGGGLSQPPAQAPGGGDALFVPRGGLKCKRRLTQK